MANEVLLISEGDVILTAGGSLPEELAKLDVEDGYSGPLPAHLVERPEERTTLTYKSRPFTVATTIDDCHGVLRSIYAVHGREGLDTFFGENENVLRKGQLYDPELFPVPDVDLYRLFREADRHLLVLAEEMLPEIEAAALLTGQQRLEDAGNKVIAEMIRYFRGVDNAGEAVHVLTSDFAGYEYLFDHGDADVKGLRAQLKALQPSLQRTLDVQNLWADARSRRFRQLDRPSFVPLGPVEAQGMIEQQRTLDILRQIEAEPQIVRLAARARQEREKLIREVAAAAIEFPIVWRIYSTPYYDDPVQLGKTVISVLRSTWQANRQLNENLAGDVEQIWKLPPLVRSVLTEAGLTLYSVTWTAAEERLAEESGPSTAVIVSMTAGLAQLGIAGMAALAGAGTIAPPIGIALFLVDAVASLVDAYQEYQNYRLQSAAFEACLDPEQALAAEPSLLSTVLTIGWDLLSLIPPARAARAVP
jgi:hypothetical protein